MRSQLRQHRGSQLAAIWAYPFFLKKDGVVLREEPAPPLVEILEETCLVIAENFAGERGDPALGALLERQCHRRSLIDRDAPQQLQRNKYLHTFRVAQNWEVAPNFVFPFRATGPMPSAKDLALQGAAIGRNRLLL